VKRRALASTVATLAIVAALTVAAPQAAQAHDALISSSPSSGEKVTAELNEVSLTFNEELLDVGGTGNAFAIQVRGPGNRYYEAACPQLKEKAVTAAVKLGGAGRYTVIWQILSKDGHPTSDTYWFEYTPPAGVAASDGFVNATICKAGEQTRPAGSEKAADDSARTGVFLTAGSILLVPVIAAAVALFFVARRRRLRDS
jgi:methionine-rich copper-binding protein CopC